jgi:hypothetical protein
VSATSQLFRASHGWLFQTLRLAALAQDCAPTALDDKEFGAILSGVSEANGVEGPLHHVAHLANAVRGP